jgi:hypothetical protein
MRLQHGRRRALYRELLQAATFLWIVFGFRKLLSDDYGLHKEFPPQLVPPTPSAFAMVGITSVLTNNTAAPRMSRILFTVFFSLLEKLDRDTFMSALRAVKSFSAIEIPEFVTSGVCRPAL